MKLPDIAAEWLQKAQDDYGFACASLEDMEYFAQICFHFQQASEKYLKAFIVANKLEFRAIHNLLELLDICRKEDRHFEELSEACRFLNPFYIDSRYPVHWPTHYDKDSAQKAKQYTEIIGNLVISCFDQ